MVEKPSEIMMKPVIPENLANQKDGTLFNPFQHFVYARHGRELMGCKSPIHEPCLYCCII